MEQLYTFEDGNIMPIENPSVDGIMNELIMSEFSGEKRTASSKTLNLINAYGFEWDPLSVAGYLTFKPYAAFMIEAVKLHLWDNIQDFCCKNSIPLQRIAGGDLYSTENKLMNKHIQLAEEVGMYGDSLLSVKGNKVLRFSGCSNKLSLLKATPFDNAFLPFGIYELSNSYRYEKEEELVYLARNRKFQLPELHIVNERLCDGLSVLLKAHSFLVQTIKDHNMDYIMLFTTTKKFVEENKWFIEQICSNCDHLPVINIINGESCENGIVFDVEYKARMQNSALLEIGTLQIDEGKTDFSYGIKYRGNPVSTIHAVFFASSVERTIYTYLDSVANDEMQIMPLWLAPVQCRILLEDNCCNYANNKQMIDLLNHYRVEIDDRPLSLQQKKQEAIEMKIPYIISVGESVTLFDRKTNLFNEYNLDQLLHCKQDKTFDLGQFSPVKLSQRVIY